jgi:hypothetical protein
MAADLCQYWRPCPSHAFYAASNINYRRKIHDAQQNKNETQVIKDDATLTPGAVESREDRRQIVLAETPQDDATELIARREDFGHTVNVEGEQREIWGVRQMASDDWYEESIL